MTWNTVNFCENQVSYALRYTGPPDSLLTQLNLYAEEKFEDEEDVRVQKQQKLQPTIQVSERPLSEPEVVFQDLVLLAKQHDNLYPVMVDILRHFRQTLQKDLGL